MSSGLFIRAMPAKYQTTLSEPDVRFDAHSGLKSDIAPCPKSAMNRLMLRSKRHLYSIT
jgi:hypothetical protein